MENYGIISVEMFMILAAWKVEEVEECSRYIYICIRRIDHCRDKIWTAFYSYIYLKVDLISLVAWSLIFCYTNSFDFLRSIVWKKGSLLLINKKKNLSSSKKKKKRLKGLIAAKRDLDKCQKRGTNGLLDRVLNAFIRRLLWKGRNFGAYHPVNLHPVKKDSSIMMMDTFR